MRSATLHCFDTDRSSGGEVYVRVSGENGNALSEARNGLTMELEENKNYIVSIEYVDTPCTYTLSIGVIFEFASAAEEKVYICLR